MVSFQIDSVSLFSEVSIRGDVDAVSIWKYALSPLDTIPYFTSILAFKLYDPLEDIPTSYSQALFIIEYSRESTEIPGDLAAAPQEWHTLYGRTEIPFASDQLNGHHALVSYHQHVSLLQIVREQEPSAKAHHIPQIPPLKVQEQNTWYVKSQYKDWAGKQKWVT